MIDIITKEEHKALYDVLCSIAIRNTIYKSFCIYTPMADVLITFK